MRRTLLDQTDHASLDAMMADECLSLSSRIAEFENANILSRCGTLETNVDDLLSRMELAESAITNHTHSYNDLTDKPKKTFGAKATVSGGNAVFHLTVDGTAGGEAIFPTGVDLDSMQLTAEEGSAPHTYGTPALSNGGKTLTVPVNKSSGINVALVGLTLLGAPTAANGSIVRLLIAGAS